MLGSTALTAARRLRIGNGLIRQRSMLGHGGFGTGLGSGGETVFAGCACD